jgi:hypothetical protein
VPVTHPKPPKSKTPECESQLLSEATRRLLKGIKAAAKKSGKPLSREELIRRGYPKDFIAQLEAA